MQMRNLQTQASNLARLICEENPDLCENLYADMLPLSGNNINAILAVVMITGAYLFMWQMRHPKTD